MSTLRLFLDESQTSLDANSVVEWRLIDGGRVGHGCDRLSQVPKAKRLELYLPTSLLLHTDAQLPPGGKRQARKLLPFALDNALLGDPAELHLAFRADDERCQVVALQSKELRLWLDHLHALGLRPQAVYSTAALLPAEHCRLVWRTQGWLFRLGKSIQWLDAKEATQPPDLLLKQVAPEQAVQLCLPAQLSKEVELVNWRSQGTVELLQLDVLAAPLASDAINLLQGDFAAGASFDIDWDKLKPSIWLAGTALGVAVLTFTAQKIAWKAEERALQDSMNSAFTAAFPREPLVDARKQLAQKLQAGLPTQQPSNGPVASLLAAAGRVPTPVDAKLVALNYQDQQLTLEYRTASEKLETIKQLLSKQGQVELVAGSKDRLRLSLAQ